MALITTQIQPSKFEAIRDRIALILAMELENQFVTFGDYELDLDVWTERGEKIDNADCPAIIVSLASGDFSSQHQGSYLGEYTYNVDIYSSKVSEDEDYGSTLSTIALHKIAGVCTKIIEDPQYKTLGFQAPSISHREVSSMIIAPPDPNDAAYVAVGRLVVKVNVVEGTDLLNALNFEGADTSVKLYNTNKGLLYSGSGYNPPVPSNQVQLLVNGEEFDIIDGGETFDLPVVDQDGNEVGQQIGNEFVVQVDGGAVTSVNGQTGAVDLDADDIDETATRFWLTSALKTAYDSAVTWISTNGANILNHIASTSNPHSTTAAQVGAPSGSGTSTGTNTGDQDLSSLQDKRIVVSTNTTAVNDGAYTLVASAIFTDPTPADGKGYSVLIRNGTATIGAVAYSTVGTLIWRLFHSGSWATYVLTNQTQLDAKQDSLGFTPENVANKTTNINGVAGTYPDTPTVKNYVDGLFVQTIPYKRSLLTFTGTTNERALDIIPLDVNTSDYLYRLFLWARMDAATGTIRVRIGTYAAPIDGGVGANSIGQQSLLGTYTISNNNRVPFVRNINIVGGASGSAISFLASNATTLNDETTAATPTVVSIDSTTQQYLYISMVLSAVGRTYTSDSLVVQKTKLT